MRTISVVAAIAAAYLAGCGEVDPGVDSNDQSVFRPTHEVWAIDQSNSPGLTHGGTLHVFSGAEPGRRRSAGARHETIDLGGATAALCQARTGSFPVRPHMVFFNRRFTHAVTSFVASGHVVIFDAATRTPIECLQTTAGVAGARQAHAAFPAPDDTYILVANQNGKKVERIATDYASNTFTLETDAALDLALCVTPNLHACQDPVLRPDNAPICPVVASDSSTAFITLRGGGLFVLDATATPMAIIGEYDRSTVHGNGCGGVQAGDRVFLNSGGGTVTNLNEFDLYAFPLRGYDAGNLPNAPAPKLIFSDDVGERDAHGILVTDNQRFLWTFDRAANAIEVFDIRRDVRLPPVDLVTPGLTLDPSPDLGDLSPDGKHAYVTLRGPNPLTGDPHVSTGDTPGLGVLEVEQTGRSAELVAVLPISNVDAGGVERADPHGIRVRRLSRR